MRYQISVYEGARLCTEIADKTPRKAWSRAEAYVRNRFEDSGQLECGAPGYSHTGRDVAYDRGKFRAIGAVREG